MLAQGLEKNKTTGKQQFKKFAISAYSIITAVFIIIYITKAYNSVESEKKSDDYIYHFTSWLLITFIYWIVFRLLWNNIQEDQLIQFNQEEEINKIKAEHNTIKTENDKTKAEYMELKLKYDKFNENCEIKEKELNDIKNKCKELEEKNTESAKQFNIQLNIINVLKLEIDNLRNEVNNKETLTNEVESMRAKLKKMNEKLNNK